ncbi:hypothetical protein Tco_0195130 [Tanacetum coccineum]
MKHCFHFLSVSSNTTLRNHIAYPHCEAKKAQQNHNPEAGQTSLARDGSVFRYDPDYLSRTIHGGFGNSTSITASLSALEPRANNEDVFQNTHATKIHFM